MNKINSSLFTWNLWRSGTLLDLGILKNRSEFILEKKNVLRKYAIGYCEAEKLICRPKINCIAVMFQKDDVIFWTHLYKNEFWEIFK